MTLRLASAAHSRGDCYVPFCKPAFGPIRRRGRRGCSSKKIQISLRRGHPNSDCGVLVILIGITGHPTAEWLAQQIVEAFP